MTPERNSDSIPDWARQERRADLEWIRENLHIFWPVATAAFAEQGRGAIVVDTTTRPAERQKGNPFAFLSQAVFEAGDDEDIQRIIQAYDPQQELVVVLIKSNNRTSTYRVGVRSR